MTSLLLGVRLHSILGAFARTKDKKISKGKLVFAAVLYLFLGVMFGAFSGMIAFAVAPTAIQNGLDWVYFGLWTFATFTVVFVFSIFETKSQIFDCKDNDLLLSLPIPPGAIIKSRIATVLILNYLEAAVILLPAIAIYAVFGGGLRGTLGMTVGFLLTPLAATALASGVGFFVAILSRKIKRKSFAALAFSLLFLGAYFWLYSGLMGNLENFLKSFANDPTVIVQKVGFVKPFGEAVGLAPLPFLVFLVATAAVVFLAYFLIHKNFYKIVTYKIGGKSVAYKGGVQKSASPVRAILKKDLSRFFSSANYMLNASMGIFFEIAVAVILLIKGGAAALLPKVQPFFDEIGVSNPELLVAVVLAVFFSILSSMDAVSSSALSLEGKAIGVLKSLPLGAKTVLWGKTLPHIVITTVASTVAAPLYFIASGAPIGMLPVFVLLPILANTAVGFFGTFVNVLFPKFDFQNEISVVKQSLSVAVVTCSTMFGGVVVAGGVLVLSLFLSPVVGLAAYTAFTLLFGGLCALLTFTVGAQRYDRLAV